MRLRLFLPLCLAASLLPLTACEGAAEGEGEGEEGEGEDANVDALVDAFLGFIDDCDPFGPIDDYEPILAEGALGGQFSRESLEANLQRSLDNPALAFDEDEVAACIDELNRCALTLTSNDDTACNRVFRGVREDGEGCASSQECVDGLVCNAFDGCGVCGAPPGDGDNCDLDPDPISITFGDCADGLVCVGGDEGEGATCRVPLGVGDPCDVFNDACGAGLTCDDIDGPAVCVADDNGVDFEAGTACVDTCGGTSKFLACVDGTCVQATVAQPGDACDTNTQNAAAWCINSFAGVNFCVPSVEDPAVGVCTAIGSVGDDCVSDRCIDAVCDTDTDTCVALPGVGDPCPGFACEDGLICNSDVDPAVCANRPDVGDPCIDFECADGAFCNQTDVCQALPGEGDACPDDRCGDDLECKDGVCAPFDEQLICAE